MAPSRKSQREKTGAPETPMAPSRKSQREKTGAPETPSRKSRREKAGAPETRMAWKVPMDLLRDIIARTDHRTLIRCAATCNLLRSHILSPPFDPRVTRAAPYILAYLCADTKKPIALVHPTTPVASTFCHKHLVRFLSRKAVGALLHEYKPVSSRHGLVVLRRLNIKDRPKSDRCLDLCVYDPMSGAQSFFSDPTEIKSNREYDPKYVLLTSADGIDSSFMLLVFDFHLASMRVHTASSSCGTWGFVSCESDLWWSLKKHGDPAVLSGGVVHWLARYGEKIVSYDLGTGKTGLLKLPCTNYDYNDGNQLHLATSSDGKLLRLFVIEGFMMFVWLHLPVSAAAGASGWSLEASIDMKDKLWSLDPRITDGPDETRIEFEGSGKRTGEVVFLVVVRTRHYTDFYSDTLIVFDLETKKMHKQKKGLSLLEIDLPSRLQTMKIFS